MVAAVPTAIAERKRHGMGKARYRGMRKNLLLQQGLTAGLLDLKGLFALPDAFERLQAA